MALEMPFNDGFSIGSMSQPIDATQSCVIHMLSKGTPATMSVTSIDAGSLNAIRAVLIKLADSPNGVLPGQNLHMDLATNTVAVTYRGYGEQVASTTTPITATVEPKAGEIRFLFSNFSFNLEPYIIETDSGIEYLDPYYYYVDQTEIIIIIPVSKFDSIMLPPLNKRFPYMRFSRLNAEVYKFIKTKNMGGMRDGTTVPSKSSIKRH